jgi:hypothetical protein
MVERYRQQTQPQAAEVARPGPSAATQFGQLVQTVGEPVMRIIDQRNRSLESAALNRARLDLSREGLQLELDLQKEAGPAGDGYTPAVQQKRAELRAKIWDSLPKSVRDSQRAQSAFDELWTADHEAATRRATLWQADQQTSYAERSLNDSLAATTAAIETDPDSSATQLEAFRKTLPDFKGLLTAEQIAKVEEQGFQQIMLATVRGLNAKGRFDDADKLIAEVGARLGVVEREAFQNETERTRAKGQTRNAAELEKLNIDSKLTPAKIEQEVSAGRITRDQGNTLILQRQAMVDRAKAQVAEARRQDQQRVTAESKALKDALEYDLLNGQATEADIHLAVNEGTLLLDDANSLIRTAREGRSNKDALAKVIAAQSVGAPLDPYDADTRKGMDQLWLSNGGASAFAQEIQPQKADGSPAPYKLNLGTSMVLDAAAKAGVIPPEAASALQGMAINGTDDQKQTAFDTVAQLWDKAPGAASAAFPDTADRVLKDALSWRMKTKAGLSGIDALRAVERENTIPNDAVLKQRKTDADKAAALMTTDGVRQALKTPAFFPWDGGAPAFAPGADAEALDMYREAFRTEFIRTGDAKVATELANAAVKRTVGATRVGGASVTMAYPPELFYAPGLEAWNENWLNEDLVAGVTDLVRAGAIPGVDKSAQVHAEDLHIVSDGQTAREARELQPPSYLVQWNGQTLDQRWRFDPGEAIGRARLEAELSANESKRQAERTRALKEAGWDPNNSAAARQQPLKARTLNELVSAEKTLSGSGRRAGAGDLWKIWDGIDQRYAQKADDIRSKFGSNPAAKTAGAERITAGNR